MKLTQELNEFNRRMSVELSGTFTNNVVPFQTEDGTLVFRGPIEGHRDPKHVGTHVSVGLDEEVRVVLDRAEAAQREEMIEKLLANLGTQVKAQYHSRSIGEYALEVQGTMRTVVG